ncbi:MAG: hypothetical protein WAZ47_03700 [Lactococcus chungangensis]
MKVDERKPCTAYLKNDGAIKVIMSSERKCAILVYIMSTLSDTRKMARQDYQKKMIQKQPKNQEPLRFHLRMLPKL